MRIFIISLGVKLGVLPSRRVFTNKSPYNVFVVITVPFKRVFKVNLYEYKLLDNCVGTPV